MLGSELDMERSCGGGSISTAVDARTPQCLFVGTCRGLGLSAHDSGIVAIVSAQYRTRARVDQDCDFARAEHQPEYIVRVFLNAMSFEQSDKDIMRPPVYCDAKLPRFRHTLEYCFPLHPLLLRNSALMIPTMPSSRISTYCWKNGDARCAPSLSNRS